jgi:hypothetical protein
MPSFAEADLLPKFTELTSMQPDSTIPTYMRSDSKLFFTNFTVFRHPVGQAPSGAVPPAAPAFVATSQVDFAIPAPAVAATLRVGCALAPAAGALTAAISSHGVDSPMDSAPVCFVKVIGKLEPHA